MIYEFPEPSSPINQGDIFFSIPILDLPNDELAIIGEDGNPYAVTWEGFAAFGQTVAAMIAVRPTIAIVATQDCDALRAPNITLFEIRSFRDVERKSKDTSKPAKWVPIITQHARVNQKWFYLPPDERIGFNEKMGADFLTPIRLPRETLVKLTSFRKGRLNDMGKHHFRERVAEFFRRFAYDEWYSLDKDELAEYRKNYPDAEPFPWQKSGEMAGGKKEGINQPALVPAENRNIKEDAGTEDEAGNTLSLIPEKGLLDFLVDAGEATAELNEIIPLVDQEITEIGAKIQKHVETMSRINAGQGAARQLKQVYLLAAEDMNQFARKIDSINPDFEKTVEKQIENVTGYVKLVDPTSVEAKQELLSFGKIIENLSTAGAHSVNSVRGFRNILAELRNQRINQVFSGACNRAYHATDSLVANIEGVQTFSLTVLSAIDEKIHGGQSIKRLE